LSSDLSVTNAIFASIVFDASCADSVQIFPASH
jgi:hypothetical protein